MVSILGDGVFTVRVSSKRAAADPLRQRGMGLATDGAGVSVSPGY